MHLNYKLILIVFVFNFNYSYSQTGPGGVGNSTNNALWLKGDSGTYTDAGITETTTNGEQIRQWNDASGNNRHAVQNTLSNRPLYQATSANGMPGLEFTGDLFIDGPSLGISSNSGYTYFMTFNDTASNTGAANDEAGDYILDRATTVGDNTVSLKPITGNFYGYQKENDAGGGLGSISSTTNINTNTKIVEMRRDYNVDYQLFYNGNQESTLNDTDGPTTPPPPRIGRHAINDGLTGYINEFIIYDFALNTAQTIIVNNYLAAKYGLSLSANDLYTQDDSGRGNFDHNVAGIGQVSGDRHDDSQGGILRINNPTALTNDEFLFWGEQTKNPTYNFSTNPITHTQQLNSVWRIQRIGNSGNTTITFDISTMDLSGKQDCQPLQLIMGNNINFALTGGTDEIHDLTIDLVNQTATVTGVRLRDNRYITLRYADEIVWDGSQFFNGSGTANAPSDSDDCLKLTILSGATATLNSNAHVREIEIQTGATLNVNDGFLLEVEDNIVIDGTIDLLGEAQLIQNHTNTTSNSGNGVLIKRQQGTSNLFNYNYWSSPTNTSGFWQIGNLEDINGLIQFHNNINADPTSSPITLSHRWLYEFNGPSDDYSQWKALTTTSNIVPGIGYTMKGSGSVTDQEYIFKGTANDGNYTLAATSGNDFLIGNPYPSALDADTFIAENLGVIDGTLHFWEHFTTNNSHYLNGYQGGYATYNLTMGLPATADASGLTSGTGTAANAAPSKNIPVGQGFFVTITNNGDIEFKNDQRVFAKESDVTDTPIFYKNANSKSLISNDNRTKIRFTFTDPNLLKSYIGLGYDNNNATAGYDNGYDAKLYEEKENDMYWNLNDDKLIIQALPSININDELPVTIKVTNSGIYKFSIDKIENAPTDLSIFLKDKDTNSYYNLKSDIIELFLQSDTYLNRFTIVFQEDNSLSNDEIINKILSVYYDSPTKNLVIKNYDTLNSIKSFSIYNNIGQEVLNLESLKSNKINISHLSNGLYIINFNIGNNKNIIKFIK